MVGASVVDIMCAAVRVFGWMLESRRERTTWRDYILLPSRHQFCVVVDIRSASTIPENSDVVAERPLVLPSQAASPGHCIATSLHFVSGCIFAVEPLSR